MDLIVLYDLSFLVLFLIGVIIFLSLRWKKVQREGLLFLYKTQVGVRAIKYVGEKYKKLIHVMGYFAVGMGYILASVMTATLFWIVYTYYKRPDVVQNVKIPPLMPLVPYVDRLFNVSFLPPFYFTYWIIAILVVALVHEFFHGIFAETYGIKTKTTGFGILGPFLAAFVELDEKKMAKIENFKQRAILAAGTFANVLTTIFFILIMFLFFVFAFRPAGVMNYDYASAILPVTAVTAINGISLQNNSFSNVLYELNNTPISTVKAGNYSYLVNSTNFLEQLSETNYTLFAAYYETPALKVKLNGIISEVDGIKIKSYKQFGDILSGSKPNQTITIKTLTENGTNEYKIKLAEYPGNQSRGFLGIGPVAVSYNNRLVGVIAGWFTWFRDPYVYYAPAFNPELVKFIYDLIWWLVIINISVALMNMLPLGIFDGGRFFYLTVLRITKSKKIAEISFKTSTYIMLFLFLLLMLLWGKAFWLK